jgi:hypothetical protein
MALKDIKEDVKDSIKKANAEAGAERVKKMTLPERSIGPDMNRVTPKPSSIADRFNLMETDAVKRGADRAKAEAMPSDIADKLQDMKNQKGAEDYEKNKTYKKGGKTTAKCMARGGGIEIRGKTKGRFV